MEMFRMKPISLKIVRKEVLSHGDEVDGEDVVAVDGAVGDENAVQLKTLPFLKLKLYHLLTTISLVILKEALNLGGVEDGEEEVAVDGEDGDVNVVLLKKLLLLK